MDTDILLYTKLKKQDIVIKTIPSDQWTLFYKQVTEPPKNITKSSKQLICIFLNLVRILNIFVKANQSSLQSEIQS